MNQQLFSKTQNVIARVFYKAKEEKIFNSDHRFAHVTYYKIGNVGDTVLSQCVRRTIQTIDEKKGWKLISLKSPVTDRTIDQINKCDALIIGGGGLFIPDTNKNNISGWQWSVTTDQINRIEVPIIVYSVGYNYFRGQSGNVIFEESIKNLVERSAFIGLRNHGSITKINEILGNKNKDKIVFQPCTTTLIRKIYSGIPQKYDTKRVAINIAFDREDYRFGNNQEKILKGIAKAINEIGQKGYELVYVAHCKSDLRFLICLNEIGCRYEVKDLSYSYPHKVFEFYNSIDVAIGMRGHAQMIPFGLNCEIISLCSHDKMKWFLEDIDATDWGIELNEDIDNLSERILNKFEVIHERNRKDTIERLNNAQQELMTITEANNSVIRSIIEKRV